MAKKKKKPILSAKDRLNTIIRNSSKSTPKVGATRTSLRPEVISTKPTLRAKPTLRQEPIIARPTVSKPSVVQWIKSKQIIPTIENRINEVENNITNVIPKRVSQATDWAKQTGDRVNEKIIKPIIANQKYHDEKNKGKTAEQRRKEMLDQYKETVTKTPSITPKEAINGIKALPSFVKNSDQVKEANKDGFQAKDIPAYVSATGKTLGDMSLKTMKGMSQTVEGIKNYTKLAAAEFSYLIGDSEGSEYFKNQVKTPEYRKGSAEEYLLKKMPGENKDSFLTEKGGQIFEGLGQLVVQGLIFKTAGAKTAYAGLGASAGGNAANQALNDGASLHEAFAYGTGVGAAEVGTEMLLGGIGGAFGKGAIDDYVVGKFTKGMLTDTIAQRVRKAAIQQGIKSFGEGGEEWIAGVAGAAMQKLTYKSEEDIWELIGDQQLMDQFIMGAIVSLAASPGNIASSAKNDIDVVTGFNREQRDQVAKFESKGVDYAKAVELVGTGFTDRHMAMVEHLETTGDTRKQAIDKVTKEVKGEKVYGLTETDYKADSYNGKTTALEYRMTANKYSNQVLESAGKVANNTTETRQQILNLSKIAQKGKIDVEVVNNQIMMERGMLTQEDIDAGLIKNGYSDLKTRKLVVNIDGADPLSVVLAHEFTHLTENKAEYKLLHDGIVAEYTKNGTYNKEMTKLRDMYMKRENVKEIKDLSDADIQLLESELVANEVGKLFKDQAYIEKFASEQPGLFRKAYQVVKGMLARVTKGTKEADYLTKLKQNFEAVAKAKSKVVSKEQKPTEDDDIRFSKSKVELSEEALETIKEIKEKGGKVDSNGNVTLYHGTMKQNAEKIYQSGIMLSKEDGIFFSTNPKGQADIKSYGEQIIEFKVPVTELQMDDVFDNEIHFRIPLGNKRSLDVSKYLVKGDIRFSIVKGKPNLIAAHNLHEDDLLKSLKLGGLVMPSLAITKGVHKGFGDITLIFNKKTIDPKNPLNKVYSGDAWTPTFPSTYKKLNKDIIDDLYKKFGLSGIKSDLFEKDKAKAYEYLGRKDNVVEQYYKDNNIKPLKKYRIEGQPQYSFTGISDNSGIVELIKKKKIDIKKLMKPDPSNDIEVMSREIILEHLEYKKKLADPLTLTRLNYATRVLNNETFENPNQLQHATRIYTQLTNVLDEIIAGPKEIKKVYDEKLSKQAMYNKVVKTKAYKEYLKPYVENLYSEEDYIRNGKSLRTDTGKYREFDKVYDIATLENILKQMKQQDPKASGSFFAGNDIWGLSTKEYGSIAEIKEDSDRLVEMTREEILAQRELFQDRFNKIVTPITEETSDNPYTNIDNAFETVIDALKIRGGRSAQYNYLKKWMPKATEQTMTDIYKLMNDIMKMPTNYFEAKSGRIVGFEEVEYAVAPKGTNKEVIKGLKSYGIDIKYFEKGNEQQKDDIVNSIDDIRFSITKDSKAPNPRPAVLDRVNINKDKIDQLADAKDTTIQDINRKIANAKAMLEGYKNKDTQVYAKAQQSLINLEARKKAIETGYDQKIERVENQVERSQEEVERSERFKQRKAVLQKYYTEQADIIDSVEFKKDKKIGLFYETESLTRNFFDIMKTPAMAQKMVDEYVTPVKDSNAAINKQAMKLNETVLALGLNEQEAIYTMMLREIRLNPDTKLTPSKVQAHLRENADKIDVAKVEKAIPVFTKIYEDLFKQVNEVLVEHGYKPMPYRKGYTPHYQGFGDSKMAKLMKTLGVKYQDETLPIQISGLTGDFSPGKTFNVNALERKGDITEYNILEGYDLYLKSALDVIHHTKNIHKLRALESAIRTIGSEGSFKKALNANIAKAKELNEDGELFDEDGNRIDMQDAINETLKQINNKGQMKNFINLIHEHTNLLANKQSELDRIVEKKISRFGLTAFKAINGKVGANMIVGNLGSAISNSVVLQQTSAFVSPLSMAQATAEARGAAFKISQEIKSFSEDSTFLTNRFFENKGVWKTKLDKASDIASAVFEATDTTTSYIAVRSRYLDNLKAGLSHAEAIKEADAFADNLIAARDKGSVPVLFRSATAKGFTQFQLEVNNQLRVFFKDALKTMPLRYKEKLLEGLFAGFLKYMITAFIFNKFTKATVGRPIAFSPIDIGYDFYKTSQDDELNTSEKIDEMGNRILQELPYIGSFLGGGRMPISAALPDWDRIKQNQDFFGTTVPEVLKSIGAYVVMPFGGGQLKKSIEGAAQYFKDIPGSYTDGGQLRFEADTSPMGVIQSIVFGQWASKKAQDYFENKRRPITEKMLEEVKAGNTTVDEIQMKRELDKLKKQTAEKDKANAEKGTTKGSTKVDTNAQTFEQVYAEAQKLDNLKDQFDDDLTKDEVNALLKERKLDYLATLKSINEETKDEVAMKILNRDDFDVSEYDKYATLEEYDYATKNPADYKLITSISSYDQYKVMKDKIDYIRENTPKETRPQAVYDYLVKTKTSKVGRAMMMREYYSSYKTHNKAILDFIDKMDATGQEKIMMADRLKFKVKDWEWYLWN